MKRFNLVFVLAFALALVVPNLASADNSVNALKASCLRTHVCGQHVNCEAPFVVFELGSVEAAAASKGIAAREYKRRFKAGIDCLKCCANQFVK